MNPRFVRLLSSSFLASMGDKFFSISLSWWILNESGIENMGLTLGLVMAVTGLCNIIFVPMLGSLADIYDKRICMLCSMTASILSLVGLLACYDLLVSAHVIIYTVAVLLGIFAAFFMSAVQSCITLLVEKSQVTKAVSMVTMATPASQVIGASIAGFAIAQFGIRGSVGCDLLLYIVGFAILLQGFIGSKEFKVTQNDRPSYISQLKGGLTFLLGEKALFHSLLYFACINLFFSPILIMMPMMATSFERGNSIALAMMEGCYSGGLIIMSLLLTMMTKRRFNRDRAIFCSILTMGVCLMSIAFISSLWTTYTLLFICGAMLSLANVSLGSIYQMYVPTEYKGRFFSLLQVTVRAAAPIGFAMVGLFSDMAGVMFMVLINGTAISLLSFIWLILKKLNINYSF